MKFILPYNATLLSYKSENLGNANNIYIHIIFHFRIDLNILSSRYRYLEKIQRETDTPHVNMAGSYYYLVLVLCYVAHTVLAKQGKFS